MNRRLRQVLPPTLAAVVLLGGWYAAHYALSADLRFILPRPDQVLAAWSEHRDVLWRAALSTGTGALLGFVLATLLSLLLSLAMAASSVIRASLYPYLMVLQMTPVIVVAPILVLWVGPGLKSVTIITILVCFFPLAVNTTQGLISTDARLVELFQLWRASRWQLLWHLRLPGALPYFFTGLRIAAVLAPIGAFVGDYTAGSSAGDGGGLGFQAIIFSSQAQYAALFATAVVTCLLGFVFAGALALLSRLLLARWHDSYQAAT